MVEFSHSCFMPKHKLDFLIFKYILKNVCICFFFMKANDNLIWIGDRAQELKYTFT